MRRFSMLLILVLSVLLLGLQFAEARIEVHVSQEDGDYYVCKGGTITLLIDIWDCDLEGSMCVWDSIQTLPEWDLPDGLPPRQSGQYEGHYRGTRDITVDWQGARTFTLAVKDRPLKNAQGEPFEDDPDASTSVTLVGVSMDCIALGSGATCIGHGTNTPEQTDICAATKSEQDCVVLYAQLNPTEACMSPRVCSCLSWSGGIPGDECWVRLVTKGAWAKHTVSAVCGGTTATMLVYVVGAERGAFKPANGGFHDDGTFPDNMAPMKSGTTGMLLDPSNGIFQSRCEIQFCVRPSVLITDGDNGIFRTSDLEWDVTRDLQMRMWYLDHVTHEWYNVPNSPYWTLDDEHNDDEDNDPWSGSGHLYACDKPGWREAQTVDARVMKVNMRESVLVRFGHADPSERCSDYYPWRAFASVKKNAMGQWDWDDTYDNEVIPSWDFWGAVPITPDTVNVSGTITDASTLNPLAGATVSMSPGYSTSTASDGTYALTVDAGSVYTYTVEKNGYQSISISGPEGFVLQAGRPCTLSFKLTPVP